MFMPGLVLGRLSDMGYLRLPVFLASALLVTCTFLTAECKEFWQFLLCQGFGIGVRLPSLLLLWILLDSLAHSTPSGLVGERCRLHRSIRRCPALVPQEPRARVCVHGLRLEYRRHDLPHHTQEPHRTPKVRRCICIPLLGCISY